jgi:hypothetical protein
MALKVASVEEITEESLALFTVAMPRIGQSLV